MQVDIPGALRDLNKVADRLAELLEWQKLAQQERRPHTPPAFQFPDHTRKDIVEMYGWFINLDLCMREALNRTDLGFSIDDQTRWLRRLHEIEARVHALGIVDKFIKL